MKIIPFIISLVTALNLSSSFHNTQNYSAINESPIAINADVNSNRKVDGEDLSQLKRYLLKDTEISSVPDGDINQDGIINYLDYSQLKRILLDKYKDEPEVTTTATTTISTVPIITTVTETTTAPPVITTEATTKVTDPLITDQPVEVIYILNTNTKKFHYPSCESVKLIWEKNKRTYTGSRDDLISQGYSACKSCNP